ncbi:MAG: hypothetical protein AB8B82_16410 [Roseovarius sp.]
MRSAAQIRQATCDATTRQLRAVLERAAGPHDVLRPAPQRHAADFAALIAMLRFEIDETVLPRRVVLMCDGTTCADLVLSNRRLIRLSIDGQVIEAGTTGDADPDDVARRYAEALKALSARSGPLTLHHAGRAGHSVTSASACTATRLAGFGTTTQLGNRMKQFLESVHAGSKGWIYHAQGEEPVAYDPGAGVFEALRRLDTRLAEDAKDTSDMRRLTRNDPQCRAFAFGADVQVLLVFDRTARVVVALPEAQLKTALTTWQTLFGNAAQAG